MTDESKTAMELELLKERIWNIEDKLNVIMESTADHEAELIRLRRMNTIFLKRLIRLEVKRGKREGIYDGK